MEHDEAGLRLRHLELMLRTRIAEERLAALFRQGQIPGGAYLSKGQEGVSAALGLALRPGDTFAPCIRDLAGRLAFGEPLIEMARTYLCRATSLMRGRDGNVHRGDLSRRILPFISHLGAMLAPCLGILLAKRLRGELSTGDDPVAAAVLGDGAMATGACHEALNTAAVERLPFILLVVNNQFAYSTPNRESFACKNLADRAIGYGMAGHRVDGTDFDACRQVLTQAVGAARRGEGPQLIEATTLRRCGHGEHDDAKYITPDYYQRLPDCLEVAERRLIEQGLIEAATLASLKTRIKEEIDAVWNQALAEPEASPANDDGRVYSDRILDGQWRGAL